MDWRAEIAGRIRGDAILDAPLSLRTSVRVGGPAALLVRPADTEDVVRLLQLARECGQHVTVLGGGANTIVGDGGISGVTIRLAGGSDDVVREIGEWVELEISAGAPSARLVQLAREHGLLGAEWAAGIPGYGYRHSELGGAVVTRVRCRLRRGNPSELAASLASMEADRAYRKRTQPLNLPNSGSVFRNPPGDHAGRLIEAADLKGINEGGAGISELHANFIVNRGGATARDGVTLMATMQRTVRDRFQISLAPEVRLVGSFVPSPEVLGVVVDL